jgi:hypothetical protein
MFKRKTSSPDDDEDFDQDFGEEDEEFEEEPEDYIPELKRSKSIGDGSADDESGAADDMDEHKGSLINRWKRTAPPAIEEQKESIGTSFSVFKVTLSSDSINFGLLHVDTLFLVACFLS